MIENGHALDLIERLTESPDLIVTDPPYAFGGTGSEHAISATVATVLRESARRLKRDGWMLVMCAASWRSTAYMVESVRGVLEPVRIGTWCKPQARTKVKTTGWEWASVNVVVFKKGKGSGQHPAYADAPMLDHITAAPIIRGRRAQLPPEVARWMVRPFAVLNGLLLDPFAGSGAILDAGAACGMRTVGFEEIGPTHEQGTTSHAEILSPASGKAHAGAHDSSPLSLRGSGEGIGTTRAPRALPDGGEVWKCQYCGYTENVVGGDWDRAEPRRVAHEAQCPSNPNGPGHPLHGHIAGCG